MARPRGSKNRPKPVVAAENAAQAGDNTALTDEELQKRVIIGLAEIEHHKVDADSSNAKARNERKRLIAYGVTKDQIDFMLNLRKDKPEEMVEAWRKRQQAARWLGHRIGTQPDMFQETEQSEVDRAGAAGEKAGLEGAVCRPPYSAESPEGQAWIERWHVGNADRNRIMVQTIEGATEKAAEAFDDSLPDAGEDAPPAVPDGASEVVE